MIQFFPLSDKFPKSLSFPSCLFPSLIFRLFWHISTCLVKIITSLLFTIKSHYVWKKGGFAKTTCIVGLVYCIFSAENSFWSKETSHISWIISHHYWHQCIICKTGRIRGFSMGTVSNGQAVGTSRNYAEWIGVGRGEHNTKRCILMIWHDDDGTTRWDWKIPWGRRRNNWEKMGEIKAMKNCGGGQEGCGKMIYNIRTIPWWTTMNELAKGA